MEDSAGRSGVEMCIAVGGACVDYEHCIAITCAPKQNARCGRCASRWRRCRLCVLRGITDMRAVVVDAASGLCALHAEEDTDAALSQAQAVAPDIPSLLEVMGDYRVCARYLQVADRAMSRVRRELELLAEAGADVPLADLEKGIMWLARVRESTEDCCSLAVSLAR